MGEDKIVIIGGGVAGLACGCYLQMNGYRTEILETNNDPGGLCVAWDRGPYVFDGCMSWLAGTDPSSFLNRIWNELGAIAGRRIVKHSEFVRVEGPDSQAVALSTDLDQIARDFKRIAPEDAARIDKLVRAARRCASLDPPDQPLEVMPHRERLKLLFRYLPMLPVVFHWKNVGLAEYVGTYRNPFLREVLMAASGDARMSALVLVMVLAIRASPNVGYVIGGSRALSEAIAHRHARLGGVIRYNTHAVSISVENGKATGVLCADGMMLPATNVVSCADGRTTIFKLLEGRFVSKKLVRAYDRFDVFPGLIQASLGINRTFHDTPRNLSLLLRQPLKADDVTRHDRLEASFFDSDSEFCPAGKSIVQVRFSSRYDYWKNLKIHRPADYRKEKARVLQDIVAHLDQRFPGLASHVEHTDLATPETFESWTGNWRGSYQGWLPTPQILGRRFPRMLPGLDNFYMAGHWVEPGGGLPLAALSGRYAAQLICHRDGKKFAATLP